MYWFGESWGAPVCTPEDHRDTPVGEKCLDCVEEIEAGDSGVLMPLGDVTDDGTLVARFVPQHRNCFLRQTIGSVGHQLGKCSCFNRDPSTRFDDPPGLTAREAADAAVELFESQGFIPRRYIR